jgi:hypothetical protein
MSTAKSCCRFANISCDISGMVFYVILMGHNIFLYRVLLLRSWFYRSNYESLDKHVFKNVTVSSLARYTFPHLRNYVRVSVFEPLRALIVTQHNLWTEFFALLLNVYFWGCKQPIRTQPILLCLIFWYLSCVEAYMLAVMFSGEYILK